MEQHRTFRAGSWRALALAIAVLPGLAPAHAQTVQKCIGAQGQITLTSGACGAGERLAARYDAAPEPVPTVAVVPADRPATAAPSRARGSVAGARRARGGAARARTKPDACQAARARRDRTLQRVGLKRTFDLLRKLDDEVWAACR